MATPATSVLPLSGDELIDATTSGYRWNSGEPVYYSFSDGLNGETWAQPGNIRSLLESVFGIIGTYVAIDFAYAGFFANPQSAAIAGSNINLSIDDVFISDALNDNVLAIGLFPNVAFAQNALGGLGYAGAEGDVYINTNSVANNYGYEPGDAGFSLVLHELGHTLGLKHPHDDGGTSHPTFEQSGIGGFDIDWMTVMSYDDDFNWNLNAWDPATPMILDVIALQYLYGANTATNAGNDTYALQSGTNFYRTIFDASGSDTLDLSGYQDRAYVDLPKYSFSSSQYAPFGLVTSIADRDAILDGGSPRSLDWVLGNIETVIGSPFADLISGTQWAETIRSGGGDDDIFVGAGDDTVDGGDGEDWVYFDARFEDSRISREGDAWIVESASDGRNRLTGVETLVFDQAGTADVRVIADLPETLIALDPASADDWTLLAADGQLIGVGGSGQVIGTQGYQNLFVFEFSGIMTLDASFNRGGDIVSMSGSAADWYAALSGSNVLLANGNRQLEIPVGPSGLYLEFDDGFRTLRLDEEAGQVAIGSQTIGMGFSPITALPEGISPPKPAQPDASGTLLFTGGSEVTIAGNFELFGTAADEHVNLALGNFRLDPSFNRGGDRVALDEDLAGVTAWVDGSRAFLESENVVLSAPVGLVGLDIAFSDAVRTLVFDQQAGAVFIGAQQLGPEPMPLTFA